MHLYTLYNKLDSSMTKYLLVVILLLLTKITIAQKEHGLGGYSNDIKWRYINTQSAKIIFPEEIEKQAQEIAGYIDYLSAYQRYSVGFKSKKIHIILQNDQVIPNGSTTLSPFLSQFSLAPAQDQNIYGSLDWNTHLTIHEYRHVLQFSNINRKFGYVSHLLFGDPGLNLFTKIIVPRWYIDGDAILSETVLTDQGRGYIPSFNNQTKALLIDNIVYDYQKACNGSYKDMVPTTSQLGYNMVREGRNVANDGDIWNKVLNSTTGLYGVLYPFSQSLHKHTKYNTTRLYYHTMDKMQSKWSEQLDTLRLSTTYRYNIDTKDKQVTSYKNLRYDNNNLYYIRDAYDELPELKMTKLGKDKKLLTLSNLSNDHYSVKNGQIVWCEKRSHPKYPNSTYSVLFRYDIKQKEKIRLSKRTRYFSPSLSSKGDRIVLYEQDKNQKRRILILDSYDGRVLRILPTYKDGTISNPLWSKDEKSIIYISHVKNHIALIKQALLPKSKDQRFTLLTPLSDHIISNFDLTSDEVFFSASYSGIDNIYKAPLDGSLKIEQITSVKVGAYDPAIDTTTQRVYFSEFDTNGLKLKFCSTEKSLDKEVKITSLKQTNPFPIQKGKQEINTLEHNAISSQNRGKYVTKKYKGITRGLRLYSWGYTHNNNKSGIGFKVADNLNNIALFGSVKHHDDFQLIDYKLGLTYGKYPLKMDLLFNKQILDYSDAGLFSLFNNNENQYIERALRLYYPLKWNSSNASNYFQVGIQYGWYDFDINNSFTRSRDNRLSFSSNLYLGSLRNKAKMHVQPRWGYNFHIGVKKYNDQDYELNKTINTELSLFIPGIGNNDGFNIIGSIEDRESDYLPNSFWDISSTFIIPRGYYIPNARYHSSICMNYHFPLCYPDVGLNGLVYIKRVRSKLFYDYGYAEIEDPYTSVSYDSFGLELIGDTRWFNSIPVELGVRYIPSNTLLDLFTKNKEFEFIIYFSL